MTNYVEVGKDIPIALKLQETIEAVRELAAETKKMLVERTQLEQKGKLCECVSSALDDIEKSTATVESVLQIYGNIILRQISLVTQHDDHHERLKMSLESVLGQLGVQIPQEPTQ